MTFDYRWQNWTSGAETGDNLAGAKVLAPFGCSAVSQPEREFKLIREANAIGGHLFGPPYRAQTIVLVGSESLANSRKQIRFLARATRSGRRLNGVSDSIAVGWGRQVAALAVKSGRRMAELGGGDGEVRVEEGGQSARS